MTRSIFLSLLLACAAAAPSLAQSPVPTEVDSLARVRATQAESPRRVVGVLLAADSQALVIAPVRRMERLEVPLSALERLEVSLGERDAASGALHGAKRGALVGLAASAALIAFGVVLDADEGDCDGCFITATGVAAILSIPLTTATTLTGAIWGAAEPGERWYRVETPVRLRSRPPGAGRGTSP